ncbi:uncharacterized protein AMSG_10159 [Thecamonas trahens ATCC 50062]|uniref:FYVE-type domain-containing protein n=1 Tax=Thecamonas trahens ATCC 50062 TaxID=461836 RepID=A0A0L0DQY1_THETB|nr:hypothetical protein AMSG_10159 [Thecamonas trahens ATCC 50062]KNC54426.1 hypothetical protein AMSG_10159 [Thecamonas trahens ATCC 50062]|eukprot:XP_013753721.1 hypothetical protein AMSG_10159 [Thecamonas trahens ATCC 50062]
MAGKKPTREHWRPNESATHCSHPGCGTAFTFFSRRHHCRKCGNIFCSSHCTKELQLNQDAEPCLADGTFCRVCDPCHAIGYSEVLPLSAAAAAAAAATSTEAAAAAAGLPIDAAHARHHNPSHPSYGGLPVAMAVPVDVGPARFALANPEHVPSEVATDAGEAVAVGSVIDDVRTVFDNLNLVAELVHQLPTLEAKFEVVIENRSALDAGLPILNHALTLFSALLDGDSLRDAPSVYNYFVLASKDIAAAIDWLGRIDDVVLSAPIAAPATAAAVAANELSGGAGAGAGSCSDSDSESHDLVAAPAAATLPPSRPAPAFTPAPPAAVSDNTTTSAVATLVAKHEADVEATVTSLLGASDADREALQQQLRYQRKRLRADAARVAAMDASVLAEDDRLRFSQRLASVGEYLEGYAASVLAAGFEDVTGRVSALEESFYNLLTALDALDSSDEAGAAAISADIKEAGKKYASYRSELSAAAASAASPITADEAARGIDRIEDLQENLAELIRTCEKKFGSLVNFGRTGGDDASSSRLQSARIVHAQVADDMFRL